MILVETNCLVFFGCGVKNSLKLKTDSNHFKYLLVIEIFCRFEDFYK